MNGLPSVQYMTACAFLIISSQKPGPAERGLESGQKSAPTRTLRPAGPGHEARLSMIRGVCLYRGMRAAKIRARRTCPSAIKIAIGRSLRHFE
jgi:hypothetical protein